MFFKLYSIWNVHGKIFISHQSVHFARELAGNRYTFQITIITNYSIGFYKI